MSAGPKPPPRARSAQPRPTQPRPTQPGTTRPRSTRPGPARAAPPAAGGRPSDGTPARGLKAVPRSRLLLVGALLLALVGAGVWALYFSSWLTVDEVSVEGTTTLSVEEVLAAADVAIGDPLVRVDTSSIAERVEGLGPVDTVDLRRAWPDTLVITVAEREPVLVVSAADGLGVYDPAGVEFLNPPTAPAGVPVLRAADSEPTPAVLAAVISVVSDLPAGLRDRLAEVVAPTPDSIQLNLSDGIVVEWGSATDNLRKVEVLAELMKQPGRVYIVSAPGVPAIRP